MIRRVRKVLGLKAESITPFVDVTFFAGYAAIQKVSGVKLHCRLRRPDFKHATAGRFIDACCQCQPVLFRLVIQNKIVIVAVAQH